MIVKSDSVTRTKSDGMMMASRRVLPFILLEGEVVPPLSVFADEFRLNRVAAVNFKYLTLYN